MNEEKPECDNCRDSRMFKIGGVGKYETFSDGDMAGTRELKLWQCDTCKWTKII